MEVTNLFIKVSIDESEKKNKKEKRDHPIPHGRKKIILKFEIQIPFIQTIKYPLYFEI